MDEKSFRIVVQEKWLAGGIWLALLVALIFTSINAIRAPFGGSALNFLTVYQQQANTVPNGPSKFLTALLIAVVIIIILVVQLALAWRSFAVLTHNLLLSFTKARDLEYSNSIFFDQLSFNSDTLETGEGDQEIELAPDDAMDNTVSKLLRELAFIWAFSLLAYPLIVLAIELFTA